MIAAKEGKVIVTCRKIRVKPLKEINPGVPQAFKFDSYKNR